MKSFASLLQDEQAHPLALARGMVSKYGLEWLEWLPRVIRQTLVMDYEDLRLPPINLQKILAIGVILNRDSFWDDWATFMFLAQPLNNNIPLADELVELTIGQLMVAVDIATQARKELGKLSEVPKFGEEVARFVAATAKSQGVWFLPEPLEFAARFAADKWYECLSCGNHSEVVFDDGICDSCSDRFTEGEMLHLGAWRPNPKYLKDAKNIRYYEKNPTAPVRELFKKLKASPETPIPETPEGACALRTLTGYRYMKKRRDQYAEQAKSLLPEV